MKQTFAFALVVLSAAASADTVRGTIVDSAGKPLAGVRLSGFVLTRSGSQVVSTDIRAVTGKDGKFAIANAPEMPSAKAPVLLMATGKDGRFAPVRLESDGGTATFGLVPSATFVVKAVDTEGAPIAGATARLEDVIVFDPSKEAEEAKVRYVANLGDTGPSKPTDAKGVARFEGVPVGAFTKYAVSRERLLTGSGNLTLKAAGAEQTVTLGQAAVISGRVIREGKPVPNVQVIAVTTSNSRQVARAKTNERGEYRISDAFPGVVQLSADLGKLGDDWVAIGPGDINVAAGQERNGLNLVLDRGVLLHGQLLTRGSGKPVPKARVNVIQQGGTRLNRTSDAEGRFAARVSPGSWYVSIDEVGGNRLSKQVYQDVTIDAEHNPALELRVPDAALLPSIDKLEGTVVDTAGKPVADATVRNLVHFSEARTDSAGHFRFDKPTIPGDLVVAFKDGAMMREAVTVMEKPTLTLTLDGKVATLQGVVTDTEGKPLPNVELTLGGLIEDGYIYSPPTKTDANGSYRFSDLYGGVDSFFIWARVKGYGPVTLQKIRTTPGEQKTLEQMKMAVADGIIEGQVLETDGKPAVGAMVSSQVSDVPNVVTDAQGRFRLTGVPRGKHYVIAGRGRTFGSGSSGETGQTDLVIKLAPEPKPIAGLIMGNRTGQTAPEIKVASWTNNGPVDLKALRGKVVVIDLWAVWCAPCVASLPDMEKLSKQYASRGVTIIGIHAPGTAKEKVAAFAKEKGLTYPIALDVEESSSVGVTAKAFGFTGIPHFIVIDATGKIVADTNEVEDVLKAVQKLIGNA